MSIDKTFNTLVSIQVTSNNQPRVVVKFDPKDFNLDWKNGDIIRATFKKDLNFIRLSKSSKKHRKQLSFTLTSTGSGDFKFNQGLFIPYTSRRFATKPTSSTQIKTYSFSSAKNKSLIVPIHV